MLGAALTGCSLGDIVSPKVSASEAAASAQAQDPSAVALAGMGTAFFKQVSIDAMANQSAPKKGAKGVSQEDFNERFKGSIAYIKPGSMTQLDSRRMLATFGRLYVSDPTAKVETAAEDFVMSGDKAYIKSGRLKVTAGGKLQPAYADSESGTLSFESVDGKWLVSDFNPKG
jgi:hypothetical protein